MGREGFGHPCKSHSSRAPGRHPGRRESGQIRKLIRGCGRPSRSVVSTAGCLCRQPRPRATASPVGESFTVSAAGASRPGDVVVVSVPFGRYRELPTEGVAGKVVIGTNNHYPRRDGHSRNSTATAPPRASCCKRTSRRPCDQGFQRDPLDALARPDRLRPGRRRDARRGRTQASTRNPAYTMVCPPKSCASVWPPERMKLCED